MLKKIFYILSVVFLLASCVSKEYKASRGEREAIAEGNKNYEKKDFQAASENYDKAMEYVPGSLTAHFNSTLSGLRTALALSDSLKAAGLENAFVRFDSIAETVPSSLIASSSYYNMGNLMFSQQKIDESIELYKKALRINPSDSVARRNLRIAQLNRKPNDKNNGGGGDNQDNKDQDKQQDKKKEENKEDQNNQQQPQQPQEQQPQQSQQKLNQGAADRILQRSQNKENEVRRQMYKNAARQDVSKQHRVKNW